MAKKPKTWLWIIFIVLALIIGGVAGSMWFGDDFDTRWADDACSALTNTNSEFMDFNGAGSSGDLNILCKFTGGTDSFWLRPD